MTLSKIGEEEDDFCLSECDCVLCKYINTIYDKWENFQPKSRMEKILKKHIDRPSCEVSVTVCVDSCGEDWPIYMNGKPIILKPGDAAMYLGCEVEHWREEFMGDYQSQFFLHYVDKNGKNKEYALDSRPFIGAPPESKKN